LWNSFSLDFLWETDRKPVEEDGDGVVAVDMGDDNEDSDDEEDDDEKVVNPIAGATAPLLLALLPNENDGAVDVDADDDNVDVDADNDAGDEVDDDDDDDDDDAEGMPNERLG
jgi:hypothetical protein